jgi:hypothetical protein
MCLSMPRATCATVQVKQLSEVTDLLRNRGGVEYQTAKYPLQPGQEVRRVGVLMTNLHFAAVAPPPRVV